MEDNAKFCSCGGDQQVYYWDVSIGRVIRKFRSHDGEHHSLLPITYGDVSVGEETTISEEGREPKKARNA
ncbi:hypothetical protein Bca52824_016789 [Brassica carinata]|uniref:Uncharacterized protein n=1 Tax=Brassica carinata TaxID=52824 RepID=A0A8X7W5R2_BRACI|nr:hypothetical protein Bca52824_016789 [Brassica carinata]